MRTYEEKEESRTVKVLTSYTCDRCGKNMLYYYDPYNAYEPDWFSMRTGTSYPEGGMGTDFCLDLCEECSNSLLEVLKDNDFRVYEKEWDW